MWKRPRLSGYESSRGPYFGRYSVGLASANVDQKQRAQNILFPDGLNHHPEKGIFNSNNDCLFIQVGDIRKWKMWMVRRGATILEP
jgi:hypothetical protein